jgi:transposase
MDKYIGMDMDSKKIAVCVVDSKGQECHATLKPELGAVRCFIERQKSGGYRVGVAYEISGQAGWWYDNLSDVADEVKVCNPTKMTWIYRTTKKNDRIDARKMAILYRIGELPTVYMPDVQVRQWRQMIGHRRDLMSKQTAVKNQIRALIKSQGIFHPPSSGSWWKLINRVWMGSLCADVSSTSLILWRIELAGLLDQLALLENQIDRITRTLDTILATKPQAELILSIPGIGPRTTEAILAYTDNVRRFGNGKQYGSYFGLTPKLDESGSTRRVGHINKQGPSVVRWLLVECSWMVVRKSPSMRAFYERVMGGQKERKKVAIIAVARKLTEIIRRMLLTNQRFNESLVGQVLRNEKVA